MPSITPFLWYEKDAEEAMNFYASVFDRAKVISVNRVQGHTIGVEFELDGQRFIGLNGRPPQFGFNDSVSFFVACDTQQEIDTLWDKLTADGGAPNRCGWLKDKFGVTWQIVPKTLSRLLGGPDPAASKRAVDAMLQMTKLDLATLERAYDGA
jgi:predicted 3-demethylubiquinone-9 3-methyltransferase (glyoxalase superfamily)